MVCSTTTLADRISGEASFFRTKARSATGPVDRNRLDNIAEGMDIAAEIVRTLGDKDLTDPNTPRH